MPSAKEYLFLTNEEIGGRNGASEGEVVVLDTGDVTEDALRLASPGVEHGASSPIGGWLANIEVD